MTLPLTPPYALEFFEIQWRFAARIAALSRGRTVDQLARFTTIPSLIGFRTDESTFIEALDQEQQPVEVLYRIYERQPATVREGRFGCFRYAAPWRSTTKARLHFVSADTTGRPLTAARLDIRRGELKQLVRDIEARGLAVSAVRGGSWLYHLEAYRRIFPAAFVERLVSLPAEPSFMSLWGQFVRADGTLRADLAADFTDAFAAAASTAECLRAFPLPVLKAECSYDDFRDGVLRF